MYSSLRLLWLTCVFLRQKPVGFLHHQIFNIVIEKFDYANKNLIVIPGSRYYLVRPTRR